MNDLAGQARAIGEAWGAVVKAGNKEPPRSAAKRGRFLVNHESMPLSAPFHLVLSSHHPGHLRLPVSIAVLFSFLCL